MRKNFTLACIAMITAANFANAQTTRTASKLYFRPVGVNYVGTTTAMTSGNTSFSAASGTGGFTDSTNWYVKTGATTYRAVSLYSSAKSITAADTLVVNTQQITFTANVTLPTTVKYIRFETPKNSPGADATLVINSNITLTLSNTTAAIGVTNTGIVTLNAGTVASPTKIVMNGKVKAMNTGAAVSQTGATMSGVATLGVTAYAAGATTATTSGFGGFSQLGTLPIVLMGFDAIKQSTGVNVRWSTQQEFNTDVFFVERSNNGTDYVKVGTVTAAGNSTIVSNYSFTDPSPVTGIVYYRVRVIDLDGKQGLTSVKALRASSSNVKVGIYPNPATSYANIVVNADSNNPFTVSVFNQQGMLVGTQAPGMGNSIRLDLSRYTSGQYTVNVRFADGSMQSEKIMVTKN